MDRPLVSFLLPTRVVPGEAHTPSALLNSLKSIVATSSDSNAYEVLIRFDDDDVASLEVIPQIHELFAPTIADLKIIIGPRHYYTGLHHYYNELAAISTGELLLLWNDDLEILPVRCGWETRNSIGEHYGTDKWDGYETPKYEEWDMILRGDLEDMGPHIFLLFPTEVYWDLPLPSNEVLYERHISTLAFPILTRKGYEAMGHFSHSPLNDAYLVNVGCMGLEGKSIRKRSRLMLYHHPESDEIGLGWRARTPEYQVAHDIHHRDEMGELERADQEAIKAIYERGD